MAYILYLDEEEQLIFATVQKFLDKEVAPAASELEHTNDYPAEIVEGMKRLGLFANIPEPYGGLKSFGHPNSSKPSARSDFHDQRKPGLGNSLLSDGRSP